MAQGGARHKYDFIQEHHNKFDLAVDNLQSNIDNNLSITPSLHKSHDVELSPDEHISQLFSYKHQHVAQLKAIRKM